MFVYTPKPDKNLHTEMYMYNYGHTEVCAHNYGHKYIVVDSQKYKEVQTPIEISIAIHVKRDSTGIYTST